MTHLLEQLEPRRLCALHVVTYYGGTFDDGTDDRAAIQAALDAAQPGDFVLFPGGTFNVNGQLRVHGGANLRGGRGGRIEFTTAGNVQAMVIDPGAQDVSIDGMILHGNAGLIRTDDCTNVRISNNDMSWGYAGQYYERFAVKSVRSRGLKIENNFMHDALSSDRNIDVYWGSDFSYSYNVWKNVNDGGHLQSMQTNCRMLDNFATGIHRMGIEWQDNEHDPDTYGNFTVAGNVFSDWNRPYNDSFGLSVIPQFAQNVVVKNNYLCATFNGQWGQPGGNEINRFGIGMEYGGNRGDLNNPEWLAGHKGGIFDNIIVGQYSPVASQFVTGTSTSAKNTPHKGNHLYGPHPACGESGRVRAAGGGLARCATWATTPTTRTSRTRRPSRRFNRFTPASAATTRTSRRHRRPSRRNTSATSRSCGRTTSGARSSTTPATAAR
jgi:hypothetical protein